MFAQLQKGNGMKRKAALAVLLGTLLSLPASAGIQYFGYHESGQDDLGLDKVKGFTNFSYISTSANIYDTHVPNRVNAMSQRGIKAVVELGKVLWCDYDGSGYYRTLCWDWQQRWTNWKNYNAGILTPSKLLALVVRDEPFNWNVSMAEFEAAAAKVKADLAVSHPTVKIWLLESACVVAGEPCGPNPGSGAFDLYQGTLPNVDWIGLNAYYIHPETDPMYQLALSRIKSRFPNKKRIYNMDAWWSSAHEAAFGSINAMGQVAQEWYRVAKSDPEAVALGVTSWVNIEGGLGSKGFPCSVLAEHVLIGRTITGKARLQASLPIGRLEKVSSAGVATGWACDPDGTLCEDPRVDLYVNGSYSTTAWYYSPNDYVVSPQCGIGIAYRFRQNMSIGTIGRPITAFARDLDSGGVTLPSNCPDSPACIWYNNNYAPIGAFEGISATGVARGWTCDQDVPEKSLRVRIQTTDLSPQVIGTYTANLASESTINAECGGGTAHRFSVQLPSWTKGKYMIIYGLDTMEGEHFLPTTTGSGCPGVGYCTW